MTLERSLSLSLTIYNPYSSGANSPPRSSHSANGTNVSKKKDVPGVVMRQHSRFIESYGMRSGYSPQQPSLAWWSPPFLKQPSREAKFKKVYYERRNFESIINNCQTPVVIATLNVPSRCELQSVQPRLLSNDILYISEGAKEATEIYVCNLHWAWRVPVLKRTCTCVPWVECSTAILRSKLLFGTKWRIGDSVCQVGIALGGDISKTFREHFVTFARVDIGPVFLTWFFNLIHLTFHIFCANYTKVQKHS